MARIETRRSQQSSFSRDYPCLNLDAGCRRGRFDYGSECSITELTPWMCSVARDVHLLLDGNGERASFTATTLTAPRRARADSRTSAHRHRVRCCRRPPRSPNLPLARVQTVEEIRAHSMAQTSFALVILGIAASVALLIGMVGIYGVIAYAVAQRTREIGIRMALGAQIADVQRVFLRHGLWLTATGILMGIGVAMVVTRVMSTFLFGVGPMDPVTYAAVSGTLAVAALIGTYLPARRATRVDPLTALRAE